MFHIRALLSYVFAGDEAVHKSELDGYTTAFDKAKQHLFRQLEAEQAKTLHERRTLEEQLTILDAKYDQLDMQHSTQTKMLDDTKEELSALLSVHFDYKKCEMTLVSTEKRLADEIGRSERKAAKQRKAMNVVKKQLTKAQTALAEERERSRALEDEIHQLLHAPVTRERSKWDKLIQLLWRHMYREKRLLEKQRYNEDMRTLKEMGNAHSGNPMDVIKHGSLSKTLALATSSNPDIRKAAAAVLENFVEQGRAMGTCVYTAVFTVLCSLLFVLCRLCT